jgi:PKHD-type hydroxylase
MGYSAASSVVSRVSLPPMILQIADVLPTPQVELMRASLILDEASFASGRATAGWYAKDVKHNDQSAGSAALSAMETLKTALMDNAVFVSSARPKAFVKLLVSRYLPGMSYGTHVDDALMNGMRTDLSFTFFLSDPATYDGGELVIEGHEGETEVKLPAGSLVLYPTTSLHHVAEVTSGERFAIVGWVRSLIRNPEQRAILFDLDQVVASLKTSNADRPLMNATMKVRNALIRMWVED